MIITRTRRLVDAAPARIEYMIGERDGLCKQLDIMALHLESRVSTPFVPATAA